eukprot:Blabericola_migrator_1__9422@NODE_509_length_7947_cov_114_273985_g390_i0_p2_GENE_NODE_509_length_7947_cov_114_273985_g390_i0NODE_509_length_7947_cov_114_273985_g390_i0_p2_ORF_typecomplete_len889_score157_40RNB/PF00773_19/9_7e95OB_Dis3/PF17849_1/2_3e12OB_Dis3/PF17849_1/7_5e03Rrp44_CSD1/PF17216_3/1_9e12Dis3l2_C_term/PF17877_1/0_00082OB_RNB/PF08206_11/0_039CSD2/PF17876_1/1_1e02CSD2/PF17876_1/4_1_NODE_509_length_7947_cov_114_273985_g390_i07013367
MSNKFESYLTAEEYQNELIAGSIIRGLLHVNSKKPTEAYLKPFGMYMKGGISSQNAWLEDLEIAEDDVLISNLTDRNRAIHGDIVGVQLKKPEDGSVSSSDANKDEGKVKYIEVQEDRGRYQTFYAVLRSNRSPSATQELVDKWGGDVEFRTDLYVDWSRDMAIKAVPLDRRIPWFRIELSHLQWLAHKKSKAFANNLLQINMLPEYTVYEVKLVNWKQNASLPNGNIIREVGVLGDVDVEEEVALKEAGLLDHRDAIPADIVDFVKDRVKEVQERLDNIIKEEQRVDLRGAPVFTIDPSTARDLDDAISLVRKDGHLEVSVHIADVSYFVTGGTPLDNLASDRTTTVYLPHKAYHMLPRELSEGACSLNIESPHLSFTCTFCVDYNGKVLEDIPPRFFKSAIQNKYQLNYDQVQKILDKMRPESRTVMENRQNPTYLVSAVDLTTIDDKLAECPSYPIESLISDLVLLEDITQKMRRARFDNGSLSLDKVQLRFRCVPPEDSSTSDESTNSFKVVDTAGNLVPGEPLEIYVDEQSSSHQLIEELMLMANQLVAKRLTASVLGQFAVCRYHPPMLSDKAEKIKVFMQAMNLECDLDSAKGVQQTLDRVFAKYGPRIGMAIEQILIQGLRLAEYGPYGSEQVPGSYHYALAFTHYTHFTSPIRRYPDILVHRLLDIILKLEQQGYKETVDLLTGESIDPVLQAALEDYGYTSMEALETECSLCNSKKEMSKKAQEKAGISWLLMFLIKQPAPKATLATVLSVADKSLDVFITEMGLRRRIEYQTKGSARINSKLRKEYEACVELPTSYALSSDDAHTCTITWDSSRQYTLQPCSAIPCWILPSQDVPLDFLVLPVPPNHEEARNLIKREKGVPKIPGQAFRGEAKALFQ